jgi:hypothetical protein
MEDKECRLGVQIFSISLPLFGTVLILFTVELALNVYNKVEVNYLSFSKSLGSLLLDV